MAAADRAPFFPRDAVIRRVNGEGVLLLGGGRAVLMQIAHPLVAKGVAEQCYEESLVVAEILGVPRSIQPPTLANFHQYVGHMVDTVEVSDDARRLSRAVLHPPAPLPARPVVDPLFLVMRHLTAGLIPP